MQSTKCYVKLLAHLDALYIKNDINNINVRNADKH